LQRLGVRARHQGGKRHGNGQGNKRVRLRADRGGSKTIMLVKKKNGLENQIIGGPGRSGTEASNEKGKREAPEGKFSKKSPRKEPKGLPPGGLVKKKGSWSREKKRKPRNQDSWGPGKLLTLGQNN